MKTHCILPVLALLAFVMIAPVLSAQITRTGGIARNFQTLDYTTRQPVRLTDFAGKIVVLDFFAYWCPPCQVSSPELQRNVQQYYAARAGNPAGVPVVVLSVNVDQSNPPQTNQFIRTAGLDRVADDTNRTVWNQFNEQDAIPLFVVINGVEGPRQWEVVAKELGWSSSSTLNALRTKIDTVRAASSGPTTPAAAPAIAAHPASLTVAEGSLAILGVDATGDGLTFQWRKDGLNLVGATSRTYATRVTPATVGNYAVVVSNSLGSVTSSAASLVARSTPDVGRLVNLAIRSNAGTGADTLIVGINITTPVANATQPVLIRGAGPSLSTFGVSGALADPSMTLYSATTAIASNDNWGGDAQIASVAAQVGAFSFDSAGSKDAALFAQPTSGSYTIQIGGAGGRGVTLAEVYDATPAGTFNPARNARLTNLSARTQVGTGGDALIAGFAIGGQTAKTVLIRAVGPTLSAFGVSGAMANPKLELYSGTTRLALNDDWAGNLQIAFAAASVGAFAIPGGSRDAAILVTLPPGSYTAQVSDVGGTAGIALVEVYDVP